MPQASDKLREEMNKYFANGGIDSAEPINYLTSMGWNFTRGGLIQKPSSEYEPTEQEWDCLYFLCDEWDYAYEG